MAQRTITSPGVEIRESDLSFTTPAAAGTSVYVTGFAQQGPLDEVLLVSTKQELTQLFGPPTNAAEKYFHYTISELLNSPATVYAGRLPYGAGSGDGFGSKYSALAYPVSSFNDQGIPSSTLRLSVSGVYVVGRPVHFELTEAEYLKIVDGSGYTWTDNGNKTRTDISSVANIGNAGIIILNKTQLANNAAFEGTYVGLIDNTELNPATNFLAITSVEGVAGTATRTPTYTNIPTPTLTFDLSSSATDGSGESISRVMENLTDYDLDSRSFDDYLQVGVFKLRKSIYANEATKLDYVLTDILVGSVNSARTQLNPNGGADVTAFIENASDSSQNVKVLINDNISQRLYGDNMLNTVGTPKTKVRTIGGSRNMTANNYGLSGITTVAASGTDMFNAIKQAPNTASIFPLGQWNGNSDTATKLIGDLPTKLERSLDNIKNDEVYNIDVVTEAGLGTIYAIEQAGSTGYYDDQSYTSTVSGAIQGLRTSGDVTFPASVTLRSNYSTIFNKFEAFVKPPYDGGERGDCIFVADPIRQILITGENTKPLADKTKNFQTSIYWPIRHQFENENTSYAAVYGNWMAINDSYSGKQCWVPSSGYAAAAMARSDAATFPWFAPAGFTRGLISFANDIAVNPNQKQRDEFYKANINPIAQFPGSGIVIFGQKTLQKKPSAFDRINVRRLFLALERPTKQLSRQFVFEQNSEFTRTRLVNALTPLFERAKNNEGLYDYLIVCDERNNTPAVIDANELVVDIYIKPTRTAEFILVNFYATRTDANFQELIGG
jgi:phage tail sheath protein FI